MNLNILVLNAGSSSLKYQVFDMNTQQVLMKGLIDRIGEAGSATVHHQAALEQIVAHLERAQLPIRAIGHRAVHGGEAFHDAALITPDMIAVMREMIPLAPLHNPANLEGIEVAQRLFPNVPQVAVFDTAFHQTMPPVAYRYALPASLYEQQKVRRYGFHGTSHQYVAQQAAEYLGKPLRDLNLITLHLGNGCSATAIRQGKSVDTSMGLTPLEGLIMGTRCGDIDPALHFFLARQLKMSLTDLETMLNKQSGLKGICGVGDMREVQRLADQDNVDAQLAEAMFTYHVKKYIGAYYAVLGEVDALIFTGGIGENSARIRALSCDNLKGLGIELDRSKNPVSTQGIIECQTVTSRVKILVVPTNEELAIARHTLSFLS
ncbi:acetate/propionate family kinase [Thiolinea disciformis]|uniref:acetate/propionate family kinase n=1 Tax=Thiolinea disciformis TaxID=125614 RepID=UPI0003604166|nr:acetate kinase [Thiolinea disciformis]